MHQKKYVTGFVKGGLPHTSNLLNMEGHYWFIKRHKKLKLFPVVWLCWCFLLTKFEMNSSEVKSC